MLSKCTFLSVVMVMILNLSACGSAPMGEEEKLRLSGDLVIAKVRKTILDH